MEMKNCKKVASNTYKHVGLAVIRVLWRISKMILNIKNKGL